MSLGYLAQTATLLVPAADLLSAIWYSDGSGARLSSGVEGPAGDWRVVAVRLVGAGEFVEIDIAARHGEDQ